MPDLESRRFNGMIAGAAGNVMGEARMWAAGTHGPDGSWTGWLYPADLAGPLPAGRYIVTAFDGWQGEFEVSARPPSRVFEADLQLITGSGAAPWPAPDATTTEAGAPPAIGTPWQGGYVTPPVKRPGANDVPARPRPARPDTVAG